MNTMVGGSFEETMKSGGVVVSGSHSQSTFGEEMKLLKEMQDQSGNRKPLNSELWHACAGPLVSLPQVGSLAYYFPQGHSEQVAYSTRRTATSHIPNYPNLPSQLLCQVHNVTLHADKDTDEIYAQMSLQPVNSEKDVFPISDFGISSSKHPTEFFCKTLTASDTSTHGGFSVPRRAAEKLFPTLDYTMQPPTQELVVRDLHDGSWTFRHIYRGQPKRHLLTTGWSSFVGSKRLRAGDAVLFIRNEKSHLLVGVRRANRQQTTLPSSVLSADSMHIGVLAAAAHAASNRSPFTIFYNPRACPSEFVIPLAKFQKYVCGTQIAPGMRFGMMFETEESSKRRYMGSIVGANDLDPLRWPNSKWRNLQVEWDEPGCSDKQTRVSPWEIETPESLFIFPSLTSSLKRQFQSGMFGGENEWENLLKRPILRVPDSGIGDSRYFNSQAYSEQLLKMLVKPQAPNYPVYTDIHTMTSQNSSTSDHKPNDASKPDATNLAHSSKDANKTLVSNCTENLKLDPDNSNDQFGQSKEEKASLTSITPPNSVNQQAFANPNQNSLLPPNLWSMQPQAGPINTSNLLPFQSINEWSGTYKSHRPFPITRFQGSSSAFTEVINPTLPLVNQETWDHQLSNLRSNQFARYSQQNQCSLNSYGLRDLSDESNNHCGIYGFLNNNGNTEIDPSIPNTILDEICTLKNADFQNASDCLIGNFSSSQDVQSQITSASLQESQAFSRQDFPDNSGGTSSSNVDFDESSLLNSSWKQVAPPCVRTYTKVQKAGSVGRSIDVTTFKNYEELCSAIECMFGLEGLLNDPRGSGWKLVYVDYENDVLLVGDDPWEEFVGCVRCIRILSPSEVEQMSEEGMKLLNSAAMQDINGCI